MLSDVDDSELAGGRLVFSRQKSHSLASPAARADQYQKSDPIPIPILWTSFLTIPIPILGLAS